jgi:hypothetical protein
MTRRRSAAISILILLPLSIATANAAPNANDAKKITACIEAAYEKAKSAVECIGIIADPCISAASGSNNDVQESKACAARELAVWSDLITRSVAGINRNGKAFAAAVAAAQKSLADSLAKLCPIYDKVDPGTALGGANYCRLQETAVRALALDRLARSVDEH